MRRTSAVKVVKLFTNSILGYLAFLPPPPQKKKKKKKKNQRFKSFPGPKKYPSVTQFRARPGHCLQM